MNPHATNGSVSLCLLEGTVNSSPCWLTNYLGFTQIYDWSDFFLFDVEVAHLFVKKIWSLWLVWAITMQWCAYQHSRVLYLVATLWFSVCSSLAAQKWVLIFRLRLHLFYLIPQNEITFSQLNASRKTENNSPFRTQWLTKTSKRLSGTVWIAYGLNRKIKAEGRGRKEGEN